MSAVTGTLGLFSLVDLFQLLASARRTGRLVVEHPAGSARVYFDRGKAVHAEFGELRGVDAVFTLFADERGDFEFRLGLPSPDTTIELGTENLVLEAMRRLDEVDRSAGALGAPKRSEPVVQPTGVPIMAGLSQSQEREFSLNAEELAVLSQVDGHRTLNEIAAGLGLEPLAVCVISERLMRIGVLKLRNRRARTARLVTRLARRRLPPDHAGVDAHIMSAWDQALGESVREVACRRRDGSVLIFRAVQVEGGGPYLELSREALARSSLSVDETLLVRPVTDRP